MDEDEEGHQQFFVSRLMALIPDYWDVDDGYNLLRLCSNFLSLDYRNLNQLHSIAKVDFDGRITCLGLHGALFFKAGDFLQKEVARCSPAIELLRKLRKVEAGNSFSLPKEINNLPNFEALDFYYATRRDSKFVRDLPDEVSFDRLKYLRILPHHFLADDFFRNRFHKLQRLHIHSRERETSKTILHGLQTQDFAFREGLTYMEISTSVPVRDEGKFLESILFDIVPRFKNLQELGVVIMREGLCDLRSIERRLRESRAALPNNCLRTLCLRNYEHMPVKTNAGGFVVDHPEEKAAMISILNAFDGICSLSGGGEWDPGDEDDEPNIHPATSLANDRDIQYLLTLNRAGRKYITGGPTTKDTEEESASPSLPTRSLRDKPPMKPIPACLWPLIYERACRTTERPNNIGINQCATGLYYLLRNGSGLHDIISMQTGISKDHPTVLDVQGIDVRSRKRQRFF